MDDAEIVELYYREHDDVRALTSRRTGLFRGSYGEYVTASVEPGSDGDTMVALKSEPALGVNVTAEPERAESLVRERLADLADDSPTDAGGKKVPSSGDMQNPLVVAVRTVGLVLLLNLTLLALMLWLLTG